MKKYFNLLIVGVTIVGMVFTISPPKNSTLSPNTIKLDNIEEIRASYGNSSWLKKLQTHNITRSTEVDSFFLPVIMSGYIDLPGGIEPEIYSEHLFGFNPTGSFSDYYKEVSYGKFYVTGDVYGWYSSGKTKSQSVENPRNYVLRTLQASDSDINFSKYDNDGPDNIPNSGDDDGYVDGLMVIFPGKSASAYDEDDDYGDESNIWPHEWELSNAFITDDPKFGGGFIRAKEYSVCAEFYGDEIHTVGLHVHEFGHTLGLPDLYDIEWDAEDDHDVHEGIGNWGGMGGGAWTGGWDSGHYHENLAGSSPTHLSAWSKMKLGWVTPIDITTTGHYTLYPSENIPDIYKLRSTHFLGDLEKNYDTEYFLIENRQKIGFDGALPGVGLLVFHIDETRVTNVNQFHKMVDLEEADGNDDMDNEINRGDSGDPYPGSDNIREFNSDTYPSSKNYDKTSSAFSLSNITSLDGIISLDIILTDLDADIYKLLHLYPNPFNSETTINFWVPSTSNTLIEVYNINGKKVETLLNNNLNKGDYRIRWTPNNQSSGIYFIRIKSGNYEHSEKVVFIK